eukprot:COSAG04_NODE_355_length_16048_cov_133.443511_9_plen_202_part_00
MLWRSVRRRRPRRIVLAAASSAGLCACGAACCWHSSVASLQASEASEGRGDSEGDRAEVVDVLVVGGGIVGCSAAFYAAKAALAASTAPGASGRRQKSVLLLERASVASEASSLSAGTLACDGWGRDPDKVGWFGVLSNGSMAVSPTPHAPAPRRAALALLSVHAWRHAVAEGPCVVTMTARCLRSWSGWATTASCGAPAC